MPKEIADALCGIIKEIDTAGKRVGLGEVADGPSKLKAEQQDAADAEWTKRATNGRHCFRVKSTLLRCCFRRLGTTSSLQAGLSEPLEDRRE